MGNVADLGSSKPKNQSFTLYIYAFILHFPESKAVSLSIRCLARNGCLVWLDKNNVCVLVCVTISKCGDFASGNLDSLNPPQCVCVNECEMMYVCVGTMVFEDNVSISHFSLGGCSDPLLCVPFKSPSVPL